MLKHAERLDVLNRCADLTALALQLADRADNALAGALLEEALSAIRREVDGSTRRLDS